LNALAVRNLARGLPADRCPVVHLSTDYVSRAGYSAYGEDAQTQA